MAGRVVPAAVLLAIACASADMWALAANDAASSAANVASSLVADDSCLQGHVGCGLGLLQTAGSRAGAGGAAAEEEEVESRSIEMDVSVLDVFLLQLNASKPTKSEAEGDLCRTTAEIQKLTTDPETVISAYNYANPDSWQKLSQVCGIGPAQSPINIATSQTVPVAGKLDFSYEALPKRSVLNTGHNLEVLGDFGTLTLPDKGEFAAAQFHVHAPSEHTINGKFAAMELHMVHLPTGDNSGAAVVGIFFDLGFIPNPCIEKMLSNGIPNEGCERPIGKIDFEECFKNQLAGPYYSYRGSLTTPPCTEGVMFNLMAKSATITLDQYRRFKRFAYGNPANNRPTQPVNGRVIYYNER